MPEARGEKTGAPYRALTGDLYAGAAPPLLGQVAGGDRVPKPQRAHLPEWPARPVDLPVAAGAV